MGGTYTADAFRAFEAVNGVQYFASDAEYLEYMTEHADDEHAES